MDVNEPSDMNFANLRQVVNNNLSCPATTTPNPGTDDSQRYLDNYRMFQELNAKGVSLSDLLTRMDSLEAKVKSMGNSNK